LTRKKVNPEFDLESGRKDDSNNRKKIIFLLFCARLTKIVKEINFKSSLKGQRLVIARIERLSDKARERKGDF
jgi:hypothetical protein